MNRCCSGFLALSSFFLPLVLSAQCISGNCRDGFGVRVWPDGSRYMGGFVQGNRQGIGTCFWVNGSRFFGEWRGDRPEGAGVFIQAKGLRQQGLWKKGRLQEENAAWVQEKLFAQASQMQGCLSGDCLGGQGVLISQGDIYMGDLRRGLRHGIGICYYFNGSEYRGQWQDDKQHGNGQLTYADGTRRKGFFQENTFAGNAAPTSPSVSPTIRRPPASEGCLSGNCSDGQGIYLFTNGNRYEGSFQHGLPHGLGKISFPEGDVYEGFLEKGYMHGSGTMVTSGGNRVSGVWELGRFIRSSEAAAQTPVAPPESFSFYEGEVYVLLVGVSNYLNHREPLQYPDNDALNLFAFFRSPEGGAIPADHMRILVDKAATRQHILDTLRSLIDRVTPEDMVLFYFSGHGIPGAFLPIDYDGTYGSVVFHQEIVAALQRSPARFRMCIADACHAGSMDEQIAGNSPFAEGADFYRSNSEVGSDFAMLLSSTSTENSAEADRLQQSVFSYFLTRGLEGQADANADRRISIQELYQYVRENVRRYTENRQSPTLTGQFDRRKIIGIVRSRMK